MLCCVCCMAWPGRFPSVACHTLALSSCSAGCINQSLALASSSWNIHSMSCAFTRHYRIDLAQSSPRKPAVPDYIAIVPASVANSTARPECSTSASTWLQPDVGDWTTTNKQAVKRKPARLTWPGWGQTPEPPAVLFVVGSLLLALSGLLGRKTRSSSIKHHKRSCLSSSSLEQQSME